MFDMRPWFGATLLSLVGCASTPQPKPVLADVHYKSVGETLIAGKKCAVAGHMDPATAALAAMYARNRLTDFQYDEGKVASSIANAESLTYNRQFCTELAMLVAERKRQIDTHNQGVDQRRAETQQILNNLPKQTYCNRIGTQTFCNTF